MNKKTKLSCLFALGLVALCAGCENDEGDCENGMKNGESYFDGCNQITCVDGSVRTTDADCDCHLENGEVVAFNSSITMDDGCTLCTCVPWQGLECDSTACKPGPSGN